MKRIFLAIFLAIAGLSSTFAADNAQQRRWLDEIRQLRINYIVKELDLTADQKVKFTAAYEQMSRELEKQMRDTRALYNTVKKKGSAATSVELEKATEAMYEAKGKEGAIEMRYLPKFKAILTPQQLFKLKSAEHKFNRQLMKHQKADNKTNNKKK